MNHFLRIWDFQFAQKPDILVANSKNIQSRIKKFYRRDSVVIYPPVNTTVILNAVKNLKTNNQRSFSLDFARDQDDKIRKDYYLSVSRLVRGKGVDVIIQACAKLGLPLKVVGSGPELALLRASFAEAALKAEQGFAGYKNIEFLGRVPDEDLLLLYAGAKATIVASEDEDFGIVPVESMAAGTPVIAPRSGGFLETVIDKKTGIFYEKVSVDGLIEGIDSLSKLRILSSDCQKQAEKFSKERFKKEILELVERNLKK